jgi:hypothetical protein
LDFDPPLPPEPLPRLIDVVAVPASGSALVLSLL